MSRDALGALIEEFSELDPSERGDVRGSRPSRGDLILAGALVIDGVWRRAASTASRPPRPACAKASSSSACIRTAAVERRPPRTVRNLAAQYDTDFAHSEHVARLALEMWDALAAAALHPGDPEERELLWATAMLHDIGIAVDYDDHHKHSRYLILNAGLPGFSPREVALIGQAARYHRKGNPGLGEFSSSRVEGDEALLDRIAGDGAHRRAARALPRPVRPCVRRARAGRHGRAAPARHRGRHDRPLGHRAPGRRLPQGVRPHLNVT